MKKPAIKLRNEALLTLLGEIFKWAILLILVFAAAKLLLHNTSLGQFISANISISIYSLALIALLLVLITTMAVSAFFQARFNQFQKDHYTDALTGLKNYKAFRDYLPYKITELNELNQQCSVILMDVDNFKSFNTRYSQNTADKILLQLGQLLGKDKKFTDETFRQFLRGDEFVMIASNSSLEDALKAAESKRALIEGKTFFVDGKPHKLTVSCGVTTFRKNQDNFESMMDRASQALNEAKRQNGKNNIKAVA